MYCTALRYMHLTSPKNRQKLISQYLAKFSIKVKSVFLASTTNVIQTSSRVPFHIYNSRCQRHRRRRCRRGSSYLYYINPRIVAIHWKKATGIHLLNPKQLCFHLSKNLQTSNGCTAFFYDECKWRKSTISLHNWL